MRWKELTRLTPQFVEIFLGDRATLHLPCVVDRIGKDLFVDPDSECWKNIVKIVMSHPTKKLPRAVNSKTVPLDLMTLKGPGLWAELHTWALTIDEPNEYGRSPAEFLEWFSGRIPCGDCRQHFNGVVKKLPPDFSSADAMFARTVDWHNAVNARLGKPQITVEQAREIWASE